MEKTQYTQQQQQAIESNQKKLLVSASAGSGKTKVLVSRIAKLVKQQHVSLSNMLVCTFTKLSAQEMKQRLKQQLEQNIDDDFIQSQLSELNVANISTIHKFCQNIIKEFFYVAQVDPNFAVVEDDYASFLKTKAISSVFEKYQQSGDEQFKIVYEIFFENRRQDDFKNSILQIYNFLQAKDDDYIDSIIENVYQLDANSNSAIKYIQNEKDQLCEHFLHKFNNLLVQANSQSSDVLVNIISADIALITQLKNANFNEFFDVYANSDFARNYLPKSATVEQVEILEQVKYQTKNIKEKLEFLSKCFILSSKSEMEQNKNLIIEFVKIVREFKTEYSTLKQQANCLDFNDLEHLALKVLDSKSVRTQLCERFEYIFVDEYQDTNEIQEKIINLLTHDNYIFMVGDVKQSIYSFRECNPQIFINKSKILKQQKDSFISLNKNFRSDKNILNFCNLIFDNIMTESTAKLDYKHSSQLVFGETMFSQNLEPKVSVVLIDKDTQPKQLETLAYPYSVKNARLVNEKQSHIKTEALVIADKIEQLLSKTIVDDSKQRKIEYRDIAILTRSREAIKNIASVLISLGVPVCAEYKINLYECEEIKLLISLLKLLNNFNDDITLASVMKSAFDFLDNDLATIKLSSNHEYFYQCVLDYNTDDEIKQKIDILLDFVNRQRQLLQVESISQVLTLIIQQLNLAERYFGQQDYAEKLENMQFFVHSIREIEDYNLSSLLNYLDSFSGSKDETISVQKNLNSVFIGTIHSSKGLEYPVVFLADSAHNYSNKSLQAKIVKTSDFGIAMSCYNTIEKVQRESFVKNIIKYKVLQDEKQEEIRLLYVALTRAKNYLFIVGTASLDKLETVVDTYQINSVKNYLELIVGSLGEDIVRKINSKTPNISFSSENLTFNVQTILPQSVQTQSGTENVLFRQNSEFATRLKKYFNTTFTPSPYMFKNTVTALLESEEDENYNIVDFKLSKPEYKNDDDFLLIGTNYHKALQYIDFSAKSIQQVEQCLIKLSKDNIFSQDDLKLIDSQKILNACLSLSSLIDANDVVLKEKQFMFYPKLNKQLNCNETEHVLVQGMVDLMILKPNEIYIVDYKTSRINDENKFRQKYALQLNLYASAIENFYHKKVTKKIIYSFWLDKLIIV